MAWEVTRKEVVVWMTLERACCSCRLLSHMLWPVFVSEAGLFKASSM
jgi:hypothetical protein